MRKKTIGRELGDKNYLCKRNLGTGKKNSVPHKDLKSKALAPQFRTPSAAPLAARVPSDDMGSPGGQPQPTGVREQAQCRLLITRPRWLWAAKGEFLVPVPRSPFHVLLHS